MLQNIGIRQHQILKQLLENRQGLSVDDLAKNLGVSRTAIQQHFVSLESNGLIKKNMFNKTGGRPVSLYIITDKALNYFPKQYAWFSELVLDDLLETLGSEGLKTFMAHLGTRLAGSLSGQFEGKTLGERLDELVAIMCGLGYEAKLDTDSENGSITLEAVNCVYHELALKRDEVCSFDLALIAGVLETEVEQSGCMVKGDCACRFKVCSAGQTERA